MVRAGCTEFRTMLDAQLSDLDAFSAVARRRSFRAAATQRGVSPSTLSDAVRRLEARLGMRLLNRTTRSVTPTEAGARLLERLAPALGEVAAALDAVNDFRDTPTGTLRLNVPSIVAPSGLAGLSRRAWAPRPSQRYHQTCLHSPPLPQRGDTALGIRARRGDHLRYTD